jgi:hypothetical protein
VPALLAGTLFVFWNFLEALVAYMGMVGLRQPMTDKELIISSLQRVERRVRTNRLLRELALAMTVFMMVPVLFKIWDLFRPFRGLTVAIVLIMWLIGVAVFIGWKLSKKQTLADAASEIDKKASLRDELKSAYWFVSSNQTTQKSADWVELQVRRAARKASELNIEQLYPRVIPRTSYLAGALLVVLVAMNFAPFSQNHNWLLGEGAPAFSLTAEERKLIEETKKLLSAAEKMNEPELMKKLEEIVENLQAGNIDPAEALKQLEDLRNQLNEGNLDMANIQEGLDEMAQDLSGAKETSEVSEAMSEHDMQQAAEELKKLAEQGVDAKDQQAMKALQDALNQAAESAKPGMQNLANDMKNAAESLANQDQKGFQEAMKQASQDMQNLQQKMSEQQAKNAASKEIENLTDSLRQRQQEQNAKGASNPGQQQSAQQPGQKGEKGEKGESKGEESGDPNSGGESGEPGQQGQGGQEGKQGQPGEAGAQAQAGAAGTGQNPSGAPQAPMDIMGAPTKLNVKLEQEKLANGENDGGTPQKDLEEASKQERSRLDYRNVPSQLSPAQKDVLNQDKIPWEYKSLIKNYFQSIRPPRGNE